MYIALNLDLPIRSSIHIHDLDFSRMNLPVGRQDMVQVHFMDCCFEVVDVPSEILPECCPHFGGCLIEEVEGRISKDDLPTGCFLSCEFGRFAIEGRTTNELLQLEIPPGARVLLSILKKLYVQSLSGRKENALYRGLDGLHRCKVTSVVRLLESNSLAVSGGKGGEPTWLPVRRQLRRVRAMLDAPSTSKDPVIVAARAL